ncbi:unnamed protein product, partial [Amoebophrya sp. A120]|eukprot:GSA120T00024281001.1
MPIPHEKCPLRVAKNWMSFAVHAIHILKRIQRYHDKFHPSRPGSVFAMHRIWTKCVVFFVHINFGVLDLARQEGAIGKIE